MGGNFQKGYKEPTLCFEKLEDTGFCVRGDCWALALHWMPGGSGRAASFRWTPASMPHPGLQEDPQDHGDKGVLRKLVDQKNTGHPRGRPQSTRPVYKGCSRVWMVWPSG